VTKVWKIGEQKDREYNLDLKVYVGWDVGLSLKGGMLYTLFYIKIIFKKHP